MEWVFDAELWLWKSDAAWHFITVPRGVADEIEDMPLNRGGFGSVRVDVAIGSSTWRTSLFPSREVQSFILPVKKQIRSAQQLQVGDLCTVRLGLAN